MKLSVHYLHPTYDLRTLSPLLEGLHSDVQVTAGPDLPTPADCGILVAGRPLREQILASPNLRALIIPWAGLPEPTRLLMLEYPHISVHNLHHNALPVAEHAIALLLAATKFIVPMDRALRSHDWTPRYAPNPSILLNGKRALVLGYGAIGRRVAGLCRGLGMEVTAIRRRQAELPDEGCEELAIASPEALHLQLPLTDALIVCLPHTAETAGMIGTRELSLLPEHAVLVNIGRGPIVDEAALYHALSSGTLYAAGLDVWYDYPADEASRGQTPPSSLPFHELDNVVMSPHRAGGFTEREKLRMAHLVELLNAAARGETMPNGVDLKAGY